MHFSRAIPLCSAFTLLFSSCMSLPVDEYRLKATQQLAPRPTYSVVPIDGGSGPGGSSGSGDSGGSDSGSGPGSNPGNPPVTVTIVKTLPQKTSFHTVYVTSPPRTERVIETVIVTKTIQVVNISQDAKTTTTAVLPVSETHPISLSSNLEAPTSTTSLASTTIPSSDSLPTTRPAGIPLQTGCTSTSSSTSTIPTQGEGDGKGHPSSYPSWNGTILRRGSREWV
ncbi:hypothetical protein B0I37DRAFT_74699 [Chaetomium sp. MPI-CAGE-AT-0009]|nr:hypothetical protein B0I37DRAFT_74699 [Chaetomium sp. MPI-CAGE-AT-0009]